MKKNWNKWSEEDIKVAIEMIQSGRNFKEIGIVINKTHLAVTRKLIRLGYHSSYAPNSNKGITKYVNYDWNLIQNEYDNGLSYDEISNKFKLSSRAISWAINNGKMKFRSQSEGIKLAWKKNKYPKSNKIGITRYRQLCEFKFNLKNFPDKFDFKLIETYGWYKAKNRGNNPNGVTRDHMYSIKDGFINNIDTVKISHPANCRLILHGDNIKKKSKSCITFEELEERIKNW